MKYLNINSLVVNHTLVDEDDRDPFSHDYSEVSVYIKDNKLNVKNEDFHGYREIEIPDTVELMYPIKLAYIPTFNIIIVHDARLFTVVIKLLDHGNMLIHETMSVDLEDFKTVFKHSVPDAKSIEQYVDIVDSFNECYNFITCSKYKNDKYTNVMYLKITDGEHNRILKIDETESYANSDNDDATHTTELTWVASVNNDTFGIRTAMITTETHRVLT